MKLIDIIKSIEHNYKLALKTYSDIDYKDYYNYKYNSMFSLGKADIKDSKYSFITSYHLDLMSLCRLAVLEVKNGPLSVYATDGYAANFLIAVHPKVNFKAPFFKFTYDFKLESSDQTIDPKYYNKTMSKVYKDIVKLDAMGYECKCATVIIAFKKP